MRRVCYVLACSPIRSRLLLRRWLRSCLTASLLYIFWGSAIADAVDGQIFSIYGGGGTVYDDNVFRLTDGTTPQEALGLDSTQRDDFIHNAYIGGKFDKAYHQQQFTLDAMFKKFWYERFNYLGYQSLNFAGKWQWHLTPRISGDLTGTRNQHQVEFSDALGKASDIRTDQYYRLKIDWDAVAGWHPIGQISTSNSASSVPGDTQNIRTYQGEAGLRHVFRSGTFIQTVHRYIYATFPNRTVDTVNEVDTSYHQSENEVQLVWKLSGRSLIDAKAAYQSRNNPNFSQRDYKGYVGVGRYVWQPSGKLIVEAHAGHDLVDYEAGILPYATYFVGTYGGGQADWTATGKLSFRMSADYLHQHYKGSITPIIGDPWINDLQNYRIGANWNPLRNVTVLATAQRQVRIGHSPPKPQNFQDQSFSVTLNLAF